MVLFIAKAHNLFALKIVSVNQLMGDIKAQASPVDVLSFQKLVQGILAAGEINRETVATKKVLSVFG